MSIARPLTSRLLKYLPQHSIGSVTDLRLHQLRPPDAGNPKISRHMLHPQLWTHTTAEDQPEDMRAPCTAAAGAASVGDACEELIPCHVLGLHPMESNPRAQKAISLPIACRYSKTSSDDTCMTTQTEKLL